MARSPLYPFALAAALAGTLAVSQARQATFLPIEDVKPGMVGIGRTVFAGSAIEEFKVSVIGVLGNVIGPGRNLILARLEGGPLATTGVIQGMSGSPVFIDGRLVGAVSYQLGSFSKEAIAGITPIAEMIDAVRTSGSRPTGNGLDLAWPATATEVFATLRRLVDRAGAPLGTSADLRVVGAASLAELAPRLRPIGAAMVMSGFEPELRAQFGPAGASGDPSAVRRSPEAAAGPLAPGDPVGMSLIRGDLEMGGTGTVTFVDGARVYAFGHPFLNLGPTSMAMTRAHVYTVLPSLDSSMKIAGLGPVVGTVTQDRATAIGGVLGAGPRELNVTITLTSDRIAGRKLKFFVLHDQMLTPLFSFVAVLNALSSYERQAGVASVGVTGNISFGSAGRIAVDDFFAGDQSVAAASTAATAAIGALASNEWRQVLPETMDLSIRLSENQESLTVERAWLDTTRPRQGATHTLHVQLRKHRGATEVVSLPVTMPAHVAGPVTILVSDADTLATIEQRELRPGPTASFADLIDRLQNVRRHNHLYVRLLASSAGTSVRGETQPSLPVSVRSVLEADRSTSASTVSRTVVGAWQRRFDQAVKGSHEFTVTLRPPQ